MRIAIMAAGAAALAACSWPVVAPAPMAAPALPPPSAQALAGQGRYADAIALLEAAAERQPSAALLGNLGYAYYLDGRLLPAQAALERACLLEPGNALAWERLAALLEAQGETGRALDAMRHARLLREAAAATPGAGHAGPPAPPPADDLWPADMARVEVRQLSAGLVQVAHVAGRPAATPAAAPQRLEVSNGNGVRGMAARVAQRLQAEGMQVVRLTNTVPFDVELTRVEVRGGRAQELRIVLGRDMLPAQAEIKKPPAKGRRQAP